MASHADEDTMSLVTMETSALASISGTKKDTGGGNDIGNEANKSFSLSQQQMAPSLPTEPTSSYDDIDLSHSGRSFFGRKKSRKSAEIQHDLDAALYSSDNNTDNEEPLLEKNTPTKKKKSGFFSRKTKEPATPVKGRTKRYQSLDKNHSKKQLRSWAREADACDKAGVAKYEGKNYNEANIFFAQAYEHKIRVFGEHSVQVAYAVEKLAKSEDMLVSKLKYSETSNYLAESDTESVALDPSTHQVTYRYNACTHYRDARYIYEMHNIDTLKILTDMGNFFYREGMDDDALECFDTLTKTPRTYSDQEVVEVSRAYFQMGEINRARNQFVDAIVCYENAFYLQKDVYGDVHDANTILLYHAAICHMEIGEEAFKEGNKSKAQESFVVVLDYLKKALTITRARIESPEVDDIDMMRLVAQANIRIDNIDGALDATAQVIETLKKSDEISSEELQVLLEQKAELFKKKGEFGDALKCLTESMELFHNNKKNSNSSRSYELYAQMVSLNKKTLNIEEAISCISAMIPIATAQDLPLEKIAELHTELGKLYVLTDNQKDAINSHLEAKKYYSKRFGPDNPEVGTTLHSLGNLYFDIGNWAECETCYDKAMAILKANPGLKYANMDTMLNNMGYFAYSIGK